MLPASSAADRNKAPILAVLQRVLPPSASVLEIASGTGQHAAHFAAAQPGWRWQPSDADPGAAAAIDAWCASLPNVAPAVALDVLSAGWPVADESLDAIFCANMLHISPWATCSSLMRGAARHLAPGGALVTYGPYLVDGVPTAPGNIAFDADLRSRNPEWGLRLLADVVAQANAAGLAFEEQVQMPANNLMLVFRKPRA